MLLLCGTSMVVMWLCCKQNTLLPCGATQRGNGGGAVTVTSTLAAGGASHALQTIMQARA
jgi:hypothetical protein